ncbi:hypothetical protein EDB89DRAFT_1906745 [Lactarius sanguifluus]|nr:hypothetical protein EDB89DRAFT_1906745 [Lactarius sanguifluus]
MAKRVTREFDSSRDEYSRLRVLVPASLREYEFAFFGARVLVYSRTYMTCLWASIGLSKSARFVTQVATPSESPRLRKLMGIASLSESTGIAPLSWSKSMGICCRGCVTAWSSSSPHCCCWRRGRSCVGRLTTTNPRQPTSCPKHDGGPPNNGYDTTTTATWRRHDGKANSNDDDVDNGNVNDGDTNDGDANNSDVEMDMTGDGSDSDTTVVGDSYTGAGFVGLYS